MSNQELTLHVYRDLSNRIKGEPEDGPLAWSAHRERLKVIRQIDSDPAFRIEDWDVADDEERPRELAEVIVQIAQEPTIQAAALGAAIYAGKVVAAQIDEVVGRAVGSLLDRLLSAFKTKKIGDFWITLPDGSTIQVNANANVTITMRDGKPIAYHVDSPPEYEGDQPTR